MPAPSIDQQLADTRRMLDLADRIDRTDSRLIGSLMIAIGNLADCVEQLNKRLADLEQREDAQYRRR